MIIPSIDLMNGRAVQLRGGAEMVLDAGDPRPIAERFARVGEIAVVDLDAALGRGDNTALIEELCQIAPCRVGGGIRDADSALSWLERGATKVVLGTAARPEVLGRLPKDRTVVALDARDGEVVVDGWRRGTGRGILERVEELRELASGFLVTFVEREGRLGGTDLVRATQIVEAAVGARVTIAGGVTTTEEVAALDRVGADAQIGMALYTDRLPLAQAFCAPLRGDMIPTVVCDPHGVALGLVYSDRESICRAIETGRGVYRSRTRGLWEKGATSGATQELIRIDADCDRDALRFTVRQAGSGFCHKETFTCFGKDAGLPALERRVLERAQETDARSYTGKLLKDEQRLANKLVEEAGELAAARGPEAVAWEAADLLYLATVTLARADVPWERVLRVLDGRAGAPPHRRDATRKDDTDEIVRPIIDDVRKQGDAALRRHGERLGDLDPDAPLVIPREALERARDRLDPEVRALLERTAHRIARFARAQRDAARDCSVDVPGGRAGHRWTPLSRVGCYAPGGRHPLPSSVLMTVVTARTAGVPEVWVASPRPDDVVLGAAAIAGADGLLACGGAQAVAALAYGTESVPRCDALVGPGNRFVTAAKARVATDVRIDMLAGPSELVVVADRSADPGRVAADLIAQAEHDPDASPFLVALDDAVADAVRSEVERQLLELPTADVARAAFGDAWWVTCDDLDQAAACVNARAPEHLALQVTDAAAAAERFGCYGALFVGTDAGEVLGDYGVGPNHVLPTAGTARLRGGLSVLDFMACRTWLQTEDPGGLAAVAADAAALARLEGLEGHARSAERRISPSRVSAAPRQAET